MQVHKETIDKIPGAVQGRDSIDVEVYGMEGIPQEYDGTAEPKAKKPAFSIPTTSTPIMPSFPMPGMFHPMPPMPMQAPTPYVTGQFFGARPQLPSFPAVIKSAFPPAMSRAFPTLPQPSAALAAAAASMNAANIPLPASIPLPTSFPSYQSATTVVSASDSALTTTGQQALPSTSAQPSSSSTAPRAISSKTRIVVPDENISLEENMANRLELLAQVRYH